MAPLRGVRALAALWLSTFLFLSSSIQDLTPTDGTDPKTLEFQDQNTTNVYLYNVTTPSSVFIEVIPCGGEFNWTFSSPSGITLANGGYSGPQIEIGGTLTGHHNETYYNDDAPLGVYYLRIETGRGIGGFVYFQIYIWPSLRNSNRPQLPVDDRLKATVATTDKVSLAWEPSSTPNVEYCVYYLKKGDAVDLVVHSSICSTQFTQKGIGKLCTRNSNVNVTGLTAGTLYTFNMVVSLPSSHIRSAYVGVQFGTLRDSDLTGKWAVVGKMDTEVLVDHVLKDSYVREKYLREFDFAVERSSKSVEFLIKPCGGFLHWEITAPNETILQQGSFEESHELGFNAKGYLAGAAKNLILRNPPMGIYKVTVRGGHHTDVANARISFQLFVTTNVHMGSYYPKLPQNKTLLLIKQRLSGITLKWDPSPTEGVSYCVYYHAVNQNPPYLIYTSECSSNNTNVSISGPCVKETKVTLLNPKLDSLIYYIDVVVFEPKLPQFRSAYIGVLANTTDFIVTQSPTTQRPVTQFVGAGQELLISTPVILIVFTMLCVYLLI